MQIKFLQLWLATSQSDKQLIYYAQGPEFINQITEFVDQISGNNLTVGDVFTAYLRALKRYMSGENRRLDNMNVFDQVVSSV